MPKQKPKIKRLKCYISLVCKPDSISRILPDKKKTKIKAWANLYITPMDKEAGLALSRFYLLAENMKADLMHIFTATGPAVPDEFNSPTNLWVTLTPDSKKSKKFHKRLLKYYKPKRR